MKPKSITLTFLFIASISLLMAQDRTCECSVVLNDMIEKLEANYIGLKHFEAKGKGKKYEQRKNTFSEKVAQTSASKCTQVLDEFLSYFDDGHLFVYERPEYTEAELDSIDQMLESKKMDVERVRSLLKLEGKMTKSGKADEIIGTYSDGISEIAIVRDFKTFNVYVLETTDEKIRPGELLASFEWTGEDYQGVYYANKNEARYTEAQLYKEGMLLHISGGIDWIKLDSEYMREVGMVDFENRIDLPTIQKFDDENVLFSVPSFSIDYQKYVDVLMANEETLLNAKNLIIDIRGNTGGNAIYMAFFDLFSDKKSGISQGHVLASEANKAYFERNVQFSSEIYQPVVGRITENIGQIVDGPLYPARAIALNVKSQIKNVAILTDEACASTAESFILHAKENSSMIKTFGSPTRGMIDYTSVNVLTLKSGNQNIYFGYPTSTLHKDIPEKGYNKTGIIPDVPIKAKVKDKVGFVLDYYRDRDKK